jgi:mannan endo-1,4-beta-mannosidase
VNEASLPGRLDAAAVIQPVTPRPSPEAVALLRYLYTISGARTLTGQHCVPRVGSTRLAGVHKQTDRYPAVFGQDFGFSAPGTWDGINFRQQIVDEAIRRHAEGFIITLMWHAVRPIDDEPATFEQSVQGSLTGQEWQDLVTPGTGTHERWKSQVDVTLPTCPGTGVSWGTHGPMAHVTPQRLRPSRKAVAP